MHLLVSAHDFYPDPGSGGTGRYVHETATRLASRGHDVSVLTRRRGDVPLRETVAGVRVARYDLSIAEESAPSIAAQLPDAARTVRDHLDAIPAPDLVSFQGTVTDFLLDHFVAEDVPRSATFHSPWPTEYRIRAGSSERLSSPRRRLNAILRERIERAILADCEQVLTLSEFMATKLREVHGQGSLADPEIVPGGVDADRYRPDAGVYEPMAEDSAGETPEVAVGPTAADGGTAADADDSLDFLTVRRLSPRMGHGMLLRAFARITREDPRANLYIAGDGPLREELQRRAAELEIADRVTFLGYVPDEELPSAYATADCFVLPTRRLEGFGLATLEALASGTPVVATPVGGTTEILSPLERDPRIPTELVVESVEVSSLAERMGAWAALAPDERASAGRACREYVRENYRWEATTDALEEQYERLTVEDSGFGSRTSADSPVPSLTD